MCSPSGAPSAQDPLWRELVLQTIPSARMSEEGVQLALGPLVASCRQAGESVEVSISIGNRPGDPGWWDDHMLALAQSRPSGVRHRIEGDAIEVTVTVPDEGDPSRAVRVARMRLWNEMVRIYDLVSATDG